MIRATTPTHTFELPFDYEQFVSKILITYKQGKDIILEKTENDISFSGNTVSFELTQEETNLFNGEMIVDIQVRVLTKGGEALASETWHKTVNDVLNDKVL
jgi:hypothetical protein